MITILIVVSAPVLAQEALLVRNGRINTVLIVTEELEAATGSFAARGETRDVDRTVAEIKEHLGMRAEGDIERFHVPAAEASERAEEQVEAGLSVIVLGGPELEGALRKSLAGRGDHPEAFALRVKDGVATVMGETPKAVLNGVYELLEQLGFRWYMPGDFGRVGPSGDTHALRAQEIVQVPSLYLDQ